MKSWLRHPAFGNKRKRILCAHTEENSFSLPHEAAQPGLPEDTHALPLPGSLWSLTSPQRLAAGDLGSRIQSREGSEAGAGADARDEGYGRYGRS